MSTSDWTMLVGIASAVPCAVLGCFLVLRRLSLLGDAISHAVLPGLALAFLLSGSLTGLPMILGAGILGILTAYLTELVHRNVGVPEDASMGVVFTSLFAIGVLLITRAASGTDLDPGCVLYGLIEFTSLDTIPIFGIEVPRALGTLVPVGIVTFVFVAVLWKELKIVSFDPALATAMGFQVAFVHYSLMAMVAGVTVASFESVGSILVIAMLIVPAATAQLLAERLLAMILWAMVIAILSAILGYQFAAYWNTSVAGMMAVASGALLMLAIVFAPKTGVVPRKIQRLRLALRIAREDFLGHLYRFEESTDPTVVRQLKQPVGLARLGRWQLQYWGWIARSNSNWQLTSQGKSVAQELVRTHRLWERYLNERVGLPLDHIHAPADRVEHHIDPNLQHRVAEDLGHPSEDPHGRMIPQTKPNQD